MNLRAIRYLVTLADLRHFSKAAERCHVSQPTLSTQVRKLEDELGVQLVERSSRKVMLTEIGEEIVERARSMLSEADTIRAIARRSKDPHSGTLRLGVFPTLAPYLLPHVVPKIRQRFPKLTLRLFEEKTNAIIQMLHQGQLDAALLALPIADDQLSTRLLFNEPFVLATSEQHPLAQKARIELDDLDDQQLLLLEDGHCMRDQALEVCHLAGAHEQLDFHASSIETLRQMVAVDTGITLMPILAVKPPVAATSNLAVRPFGTPGPSRSIALVWRKSSALYAFLEELAEVLEALEPALLEP